VIDDQLIALLEQALVMTEGQRTVERVALLARTCGALYYSPRRDRMPLLAEEATAIADELRDPVARALAAAARRRAFWDAGHLEQRLSDATELLTLGREAGDLELAMQGHAWLVVDLLEHGDSDAVNAQIEAFAAGADHLRQPLYLWHASVWRGMRALLAGRLEEAERFAEAALALGAPGEAVTAPQYYAAQLLAIRREQGRMAELEQPARQFVESNPQRPTWRAALVTLLCELDRTEEAQQELDLLAARRFQDIEQDGDWMTSITLLADCCADLGDAERAQDLYELLTPYREANVVIGLAVVCNGSAARYLGRLAATMGSERDATAHFERALVADAALKAPVCLARTQLAYASMLGPDSPRARALLASATATAEKLQLSAVLRRAAQLNWA
jgi:tetratricopeptide (TPR) repeat protein